MKKIISIILTLCLLLALSCASASASNVINTAYSRELINGEPVVYLGEIVIDGETVLTYIESDYDGYLFHIRPDYENDTFVRVDVPLAEVILSMDHTGFVELMSDYLDELELEEKGSYAEKGQAKGIRLCSDPDLTGIMDDTWSSASAVAARFYPEATLISEINENAYDVDEGFRTALAVENEERVKDIDEPATAEKCVIQIYDSNASSNVYYTVEGGQIIKHVDTTVTYTSHAISVICNRAELSTGQAGETFQATVGKWVFDRERTDENESGRLGEIVTAPGDAEIADYTARREAFLREKRELELYRGKKTVAPAAGILRGDADLTGDVTILDATAIQRTLAALAVSAFSERAADIDGNGLEILDATYIQRWLAGLENTYGVGEPIA